MRSKNTRMKINNSSNFKICFETLLLDGLRCIKQETLKNVFTTKLLDSFTQVCIVSHRSEINRQARTEGKYLSGRILVAYHYTKMAWNKSALVDN